MKKPGNPLPAGLRVSASKLAQMGVCERLVVFEQRYGKYRTGEQRQAIQRGLHAHRRFYRDRHRGAFANGHRFNAPRIAVVLYGWLRQAVRAILWPIRWSISRLIKGEERGDGS